jgi:hypothetical protein
VAVQRVKRQKKNIRGCQSANEIYQPKDRRGGRSFIRTLSIVVAAWLVQWIPTAVNLGFLDRSRYFFIQVTPQLSSRRTDTVTYPLFPRKSCAGNWARDHWICNQELWPLDRRGGQSVKGVRECVRNNLFNEKRWRTVFWQLCGEMMRWTISLDKWWNIVPPLLSESQSGVPD